MVEITKTSSSISQNLMFTTLKKFEDYLVITYPIGFDLQVKGNFVHIREVASHPKVEEKNETK